MTVSLVRGFLDEFERLEAAMPGYRHAWIRQLRRDRIDAFIATGLPGRREEAWRYTPLKGLEQKAFALPRGREIALPLPAVFENARARLVFVDGRFSPQLSRLPHEWGVEFVPLSSALDDPDAGARFRLARLMGSGDDALDHLNAALATDGLLISVRAGWRPPEPLHLVYLGSAQGLAWHLRLLIALDAGAQLSLVEHAGDFGEQAQLSTVVGEIQVGEDAGLEWVRFQDAGARSLALSRYRLQVEAKGVVALTAIDCGGELVRTEWHNELRGPQARCDMAGVARLNGQQHVEQVVAVRHLQPHTSAEVRFRGVAEGRSRAIFSGLLHVAPGASGTETRLNSRNLLLSTQAEIDTRPVLEIHNDEVVAAHGATVGQFDPEALFYLRSRGFSEAAARSILLGAFLDEVVRRLPRPALAAWVSARLGIGEWADQLAAESR